MKYIKGITTPRITGSWIENELSTEKKLMSMVLDRNIFIKSSMVVGHTYEDAVREYKNAMRRMKNGKTAKGK